MSPRFDEVHLKIIVIRGAINYAKRKKELEKNGKKGPFRKKPPSHFVGLHNDKINCLILFKFFRIS